MMQKKNNTEVIKTSRGDYDFINNSTDLFTSTSLSIPSDETLVTIVYQGRQFFGNKRDVLLEQLERQGIQIPYSCRSGICNICKVKFLSGNIIPLTINAIALLPWILSCSCLPSGHVYLE